MLKSLESDSDKYFSTIIKELDSNLFPLIYKFIFLLHFDFYYKKLRTIEMGVFKDLAKSLEFLFSQGELISGHKRAKVF
jgi:hypothetical protein